MNGPMDYIAEQLRPLATPIGELVPDPANARVHPDKNLDGIAASLRAFGQVKPVVVRAETGVVVCGNGTLAAARSLGWSHLAAVRKSMDAATAAALAIADNRTGELAAWDHDALARLLPEAQAAADDPGLRAMLDELLAQVVPCPPPDPDPAGDQTGELAAKFQVLVVCQTEASQGELLERLTGEGFECRSLIS